eukprot:1618231-Amphidinium_carterae.1
MQLRRPELENIAPLEEASVLPNGTKNMPKSGKVCERCGRPRQQSHVAVPRHRLVPCLEVFVLAGCRSADLYTHLGSELAREVRPESSTRICQ